MHPCRPRTYRAQENLSSATHVQRTCRCLFASDHFYSGYLTSRFDFQKKEGQALCSSALAAGIPAMHSMLACSRGGLHQVRQRLLGKFASPGILSPAHRGCYAAGTSELPLVPVASGASLPNFRAAERPVLPFDRCDDVEQGRFPGTSRQAKTSFGTGSRSEHPGAHQRLQELVEI